MPIGCTDQLTRWGTFAEATTEAAYRFLHSQADRRTARACVLVASVGCVAFAASDYRLFGTGGPFPILMAVRAAVLLVSVMVWLQLRRKLSAATHDRMMLTWGLLVVAQILYVTSTRPLTYSGHTVVNLGAVLLTYAVVSLPLAFQMVLAGSLSLGCALLAAGDGLGTAAVVWPFLGANVSGGCVSWRLHRQGRETFAACSRLKHALAEVRTLRGLIRMCAWCKQVAVDGHWEQLEGYVKKHTHAEFTHGICPGCYAEQQRLV